MAKICVDTNCLIGLYQAALDRVDVLDDLAKHKARLVVTRQIINEFRRNRIATLKWLIKQFGKTIALEEPDTTALVNALPQNADLVSLRDQYKRKAKEIEVHLRSMVEDEGKDLVAQKVLTLWKDEAVTTLETTKANVDRALQRKLLGNPPTSPDKYTIGDEVIWETLLAAKLGDDLVVVTRDASYLDNQALLKDEYATATQCQLILITEHFGDALKVVGATPSEQLRETEKDLDQAAEAAARLRRVMESLWGSGPISWARMLQDYRASGKLSDASWARLASLDAAKVGWPESLPETGQSLAEIGRQLLKTEAERKQRDG